MAEVKNLTVGVSGKELKESHKLEVNMDFSDVSRETLIDWAAKERVIAMQRALRTVGDAGLKELAGNGPYEVHALNAGKKPMTEAERMETIKATVAAMTPEERKAVAELLKNQK